MGSRVNVGQPQQLDLALVLWIIIADRESGLDLNAYQPIASFFFQDNIYSMDSACPASIQLFNLFICIWKCIHTDYSADLPQHILAGGHEVLNNGRNDGGSMYILYSTSSRFQIRSLLTCEPSLQECLQI